MFKKIFNIFHLPTPHELGYADKHNALPIIPSNDPTEITWDEYDQEMKIQYPIKWFINKTIPRIFSDSKWHISNLIYWLKCHILPSYKYHQLDLRQQHPKDYYNYGWVDIDRRMVYALFNLLNLFVEKELNQMTCPSENEVTYSYQRDIFFEVKRLHYWWNIERPRQIIRYRNELSANLHFNHDAANNSIKYQEFRDFEKTLEVKEEEMIFRLIKIRKNLWT